MLLDESFRGVEKSSKMLEYRREEAKSNTRCEGGGRMMGVHGITRDGPLMAD